MIDRLNWLSSEAQKHGWELLARYRAGRVTYVLVDDQHGEMDCNTLDGVERKMRALCEARNLPLLREI
jgi:hypothetical protein